MDKSKKYKERSTRHTYKTKDRVTRTSLKTNNTMDKSKKYKERSTKHTYKTFLLLSIVLFVFSGVLVTLSLVLYVCLVDRSLYFLLLSINIHIKLKIE
jgi:nitrate reductase NapE component